MLNRVINAQIELIKLQLGSIRDANAICSMQTEELKIKQR